MSKEYWKPVIYKGINYTEMYEVSNLGRVKSYHKNKLGRIMKPRIHYKKGYCSVELSNKVFKKFASIHVLVALMFIGDIPKGYEVNHKNTIKTDNKAKNLEIITHRLNTSLEKTKKSGLPVGVTYDKNRKMYASKITCKAHNSQSLYLGLYKTSAVASIAYQKALDVIVKNEYSHPQLIRNNVNLFRKFLGLRLIKPYSDSFCNVY